MKQELFEKGVKAAIADILERSLNKWVSVMEPGASFGAILTKNGISPKVSPALFKVLSSVGIIQREGVKSTIRYRYVPPPSLSLISINWRRRFGWRIKTTAARNVLLQGKNM